MYLNVLKVIVAVSDFFGDVSRMFLAQREGTTMLSSTESTLVPTWNIPIAKPSRLNRDRSLGLQ